MSKAKNPPPRKKKTTPQPHYEYLWCSRDAAELNGLGVVGWRAVAVYSGEVLMMRERA